VGISDSIEPAYWTRDAEASASSDASASCYCLAEDVGILAVVVAKLKFIQVQRQVFLADVVVRADDSPLQQRPKVFDIVGMDLAAYVLALAMADYFMWQRWFEKAIAWSYPVSVDGGGLADDCFE
jgi:hypothetical protein